MGKRKVKPDQQGSEVTSRYFDSSCVTKPASKPSSESMTGKAPTSGRNRKTVPMTDELSSQTGKNRGKKTGVVTDIKKIKTEPSASSVTKKTGADLKKIKTDLYESSQPKRAGAHSDIKKIKTEPTASSESNKTKTDVKKIKTESSESIPSKTKQIRTKRKSSEISTDSKTGKKQKVLHSDHKGDCDFETPVKKQMTVEGKTMHKKTPDSPIIKGNTKLPKGQKTVQGKTKQHSTAHSSGKPRKPLGEDSGKNKMNKKHLKKPPPSIPEGLKSVTPQKGRTSLGSGTSAASPMNQMASGDMMSEESDSESDWEEVEELPEQIEQKSQVPKETVQITLEDTSNIMRKKKKKRGFDMDEWFRLQANRILKESQLELHKVHLLCLLSTGLRYTELCNDLDLQAVGLSVVPSVFTQQKQTGWDIHLTTLTKWFHEDFSIDSELQENMLDLQPTLLSKVCTRRAASELEMVLLFVTLCRALGFDARLIYSLQPLTYKATDLKNKDSKRKSKDVTEVICLDNDSKSDISQNSLKSSQQTSNKTDSGTKSTDSKKKAVKVQPPKKSVKDSGSSATPSSRAQPKNRQQRQCASKVSYTEPGEESSCHSNRQQGKGTGSGGQEGEVINLDSSDEDFEPETTNFRSPTHRKSPSSAKAKVKVKQKILSSDDSNDSVQIVKSSVKERGHDYWAEVYMEAERKWICVDCVRGRVNHPEEMGPQASQPLCYVLAFDNRRHVKDVTRRYASNYMSQTRKLRVDAEWWDETLKPYEPKTVAQTERDAMEDLQLQAQLMKKPLPTSISEYKSHPMYALKRHLLKYEALYPDTCVPLGFIRGEPVYARDCVHTLHSRENWLKEARLVRIGEEPYKIVKSKKRNARMPSDEAMMLNLFGRWQTEDYIPPPAYNGKVPKNEYGNVELYKPTMLPGGTVHLKLPGLNRVAKKLGIDCAAAMVGWDYHSGFGHPLMEGFVVCEEFQETLEAAWEEDQEIQRQREAEKREKRVLGNWKLLVKTLLIREKMKIRFQLTNQNLTEAKETSTSHSSEGGTKAVDTELSWPRNQRNDSQSTAAKTSKDKSHLFPFEVEEL